MKITAQNIKAWQQNSAAAFNQWLEDVKPKILTRSGKYETFKPTKAQRAVIENVLTSLKNRFTNTISLNIQPRRHAKSTLYALIILWLFTSRRNYTVMLLGNSELHARRVQFNLLARIIRNTPILAAAIPESNVRQYNIVFPALSNTIQLAPTNLSVSFGDQANLLWVSDLHAAQDLAPFNALQASLLDSEDSLCFIDSNVDTTDGPVHGLQMEAETDPSLFCKYVSYRDFEDFTANAPPWIDRQKAKRLERTTLPVDFKRDILGQRSDAKNSLFTAEIIDRCRDSYKIPILDPKELAGNRKYKTAGALDRAKSLFQTKWSDATIFTSILKMTSPKHNEPEFYILNQTKPSVNTAKGY